MVSGLRTEGGQQFLTAGHRKTIQSIKEIVGNHSEAEIYAALRENNMDPNETTQKLLNQDPFHEVKRKRDKRREVPVNKDSLSYQPRKQTEPLNQGMRLNTYSSHPRKHTEPLNQGMRFNTYSSQPRKHTEPLNQGRRFNTYSERNVRRGGYSRNALPDKRRSHKEYRVVSDNRTNQKTNSEIKSPSAHNNPIYKNEVEQVSKSSEKSSTGNQIPPDKRPSSQSSNGITDLPTRQANDSHLSDRKDSSNNFVGGVYSSSSDPVHVPSPDKRPAANIGAIKREVGAVGPRRQSNTESSVKLSSSVQSSSFSNSHLGRDGTSRESFRCSTAISKSDQSRQANVPESAVPSISVGRTFINNQHSSRHHQPLGHQKVSQPNKEWKPKLSQKQSANAGPGVIGTPAKKSASSPNAADVAKNLEKEESGQLQDELSRVNISENQNVIIAAHIRVSETDKYRVTFGSLGTTDINKSSWNPTGFQANGGAEDSHIEPASASLSISVPESSSDETSGSKQVLLDESVGNSGTNSPGSDAVSEQQLTTTDGKESSSPRDLENYADIGLVCDNGSSSYTPSESQQQQQQDPPQLPSFSTYDPQIMYDMPYFRSTVDETGRGDGLQFPLEAFSSHTGANSSIPASSTIAMVQQQTPMTQMYSQVHHLSPYGNLMPFRPQYLSPVYVPPMAVPAGYSNNPAGYPHPSNANNYLLMPGGSSHLTPANGLKYGIQQFKPIPSCSQTGFGNFTSPTGYAINAPAGVVGNATGLEDPSRLMKYKDGNIYVQNPQGEASEIWMTRDVPSMQSAAASYYNMTGQSPHAAAAYAMPSQTGHGTSFSTGAPPPQSSHMQFAGMYHPSPQPAGITNPHLGPPVMGGSVGGAPGAQVGGYQQQPQMGHMNWAGNF